MAIGRELFLHDLEPGMTVALEALAPLDKLCFPGVIYQIVKHRVIVQMHPPHETIRLYANREGRFVNDEDRAMHVYELGK